MSAASRRSPPRENTERSRWHPRPSAFFTAASPSCCCSPACPSPLRWGSPRSRSWPSSCPPPTSGRWRRPCMPSSTISRCSTIPCSCWMGAAIGKTRAGADVYGSLNAWLHKVPGGLGSPTSSRARCSRPCAAARPRRARRSAPLAFHSSSSAATGRPAAGLIAAGGTLGILIPPSPHIHPLRSRPDSPSAACSWPGSAGLMLTGPSFRGVVDQVPAQYQAALAAAPGERQRRAEYDPRQGSSRGATARGPLPRFLPFIALLIVVI